jgi:hypothetical protein
VKVKEFPPVKEHQCKPMPAWNPGEMHIFIEPAYPAIGENTYRNFSTAAIAPTYLNTYRRLLEIPQSVDTYELSADLLFALVDVDLDNALISIEDYDFSDTEEIFHDLYQELCLKTDRLPQHRIWVTGFKHKEAYFLHPSLQEIFNGYHQPIYYKNTQLQLATIYQDMATDLCKDKNLCKKFSTAA